MADLCPNQTVFETWLDFSSGNWIYLSFSLNGPWYSNARFLNGHCIQFKIMSREKFKHFFVDFSLCRASRRSETLL